MISESESESVAQGRRVSKFHLPEASVGIALREGALAI
jgi:hypothetical protein